MYNTIERLKVTKPKGKSNAKLYVYTALGLILLALLISGVVVATVKVADWGAGHQIVAQRVIDITLRYPVRVEERKQEIVISPIVERVATEPLTPIEQKIINKWGFKDGVVALAIFDCGESGLNADAVSITGDLGISQINWPINGKLIKEKFGYSPADMFNVDKNLDAAYLMWDRGNGKEGDKIGTWNAWVGFTSAAYTRCFK